jgi:hypothetical protein
MARVTIAPRDDENGGRVRHVAAASRESDSALKMEVPRLPGVSPGHGAGALYEPAQGGRRRV